MNLGYIKKKFVSDPESYIQVVDQLVTMYEKYKADNTTDLGYSLLSEMKVDPVLNFIARILFSKHYSGNIIDLPDETALGILRYLAAVFYSVKGTSEVFYKLSEYFGFEYSGKIVYTQTSLDFKLTAASVSWVRDEGRFFKYFREFLLELLFVGQSSIIDEIGTYGIEAITYRIEDTIEIKLSSNIDLIRHIEINGN